jgi:hypothetical protein
MAVTGVWLVVPVPASQSTALPALSTPPTDANDVPCPASGPRSMESGIGAAWQFCSWMTTE